MNNLTWQSAVACRNILKFLFVFLVLLFGLSEFAQAQKSPEESLKSLTSAPSMEVRLFASEPMITNPSAIDVDARGRVWVAEIQWYRKDAKESPLDKIKVLEDTDHDGRADKVTVFADGLLCPMSICVVGDRVYSFVHGDLLMWEDKNGDLKPDGPAKTILTGFSNANHDHTAHSMIVGPDHKWYMSHGDEGFDVKGTDGSKIKSQYGAMIRGELDGSKLEVVADNFRNPYEICVSSFGEEFCSDNDNDGNQSVRICWILEGGDYGWFGRPPFKKNELDARVPRGTPFREHWHFRGYIPGYVPATIVTGFGSPCGICFYEGDAFGANYKNVAMHCDAGPREVRVYRHKQLGFGMQGKSEVIITTPESSKGDKYFRPDDICSAPDGTLFISDWYDGGVGGHAFDDPDRGRIFHVVPKDKKVVSTLELPIKTTQHALQALRNPNLDTQFQAREKLLADGKASIASLAKLANDPNEDPNYRARALWLLDRIGSEGQSEVAKFLTSKDEQLRALAVRILGRHGVQTCKQWIAYCVDPSPQVAREALLSIRRIPANSTAPEALEINKYLTLAMDKYDGTDRYQLETLNVAAAGRKELLSKHLIASSKPPQMVLPLFQLFNPESAGELLQKSLLAEKDPKKVNDWITASAQLPDPKIGFALLEVLKNDKITTENRKLVLTTVMNNIDGAWSELAKSDSLKQSIQSLLQLNGNQIDALHFIRRAGWTDQAKAILKLINDEKQPDEVRNEAITTALELRIPNLSETIKKLVSHKNEKLRRFAFQGLIVLQDVNAVKAILIDNKTSVSDHKEFLKSAMENMGVALGLFKALEQNAFAEGLKKEILEIATNHPDTSIRVLFDKFLPPEQRQKKLGDVMKAEDILKLVGNAERGKQIFHKSSAAQCNNCHMIDGQGGTLGPDLSLIGKKFERASLLETILKPSKAIAHGYETHILETTDGLNYAGFVVENSDKQVVLRDTKQNLVRVPRTDVEKLVKSNISLMPELVLRDVSAQDAADLLQYLSSLTSGTLMVNEFRVIGPFRTNKNGLDTVHPIENTAGNPNLNEKHPLSKTTKLSWEHVRSDGKLGFVGIDLTAFDTAKKMSDEKTLHFLLVYAESLTDQKAELQIGSDDSVKVWVNGELVHRNQTTRALAANQDQVTVSLKRGKNTILMKIINGGTPCGAALGIKSSDPINLGTE